MDYWLYDTGGMASLEIYSAWGGSVDKDPQKLMSLERNLSATQLGVYSTFLFLLKFL